MTVNMSFVHDRQFVEHGASIEGESQELVDILHKIVQNAGALLEVRNCSVALLDVSGTALVTLAALQRNGHKPRHTRFRMNEGVAGWVAKHREPLVINDVALDPRFKRLGRTPIGSMMCVPLIDAGVFVGTLTASSTETHAFSARKAQMLTIFAEQAVLAIINARHAELAQRQAKQLEMLLDLSRGITTRLEPDALYRTILADVLHLVSCDLAMLYRYQEGTQELISVAELEHVEPSTDELDRYRYSVAVKTKDARQERINLYNEHSVIAWAAMHRHPMLHEPLQRMVEHALIDAADTSPAMNNHAMMAAPLVSKNVLYGVLALQRAAPFTSEELRLVRNLSNMAAAALENVSLVHKVRTDQEQLRAILVSSSDGIALLGVNACFIEVNPAFGRIFGMEPAQIIGMECLELLECEQEGQASQPGQPDQVAHEGHAHCRELCMIHKALQQEEALPYIEVDLIIQGAQRSLGLSITPVATTQVPLCLMMARDVTAIRDASRMKANFISMVTHELRSPLNSINGYLDLALGGVAGELNEQLHEFLLRARAGSENLYALLEDLLLVSRADAGQWRLNREIIDLVEIIHNAVEELELTAQDNGLTITLMIEDEPHFPRLYADAVRIQQILRNLISNALHFTPAGGKITVAAQVVPNTYEHISEEHTHVVHLRVSDTGCGIPPEFLERIFDRFYQVPNNVMSRKGQGLGLSIVKMVVELHGGFVRVESTPGEGSTFSCVLPCLLS